MDTQPITRAFVVPAVGPAGAVAVVVLGTEQDMAVLESMGKLLVDFRHRRDVVTVAEQLELMKAMQAKAEYVAGGGELQ